MLSYEASEEIIGHYPWLQSYRRQLEASLMAEASFWQQYSHEEGELGDYQAAVKKSCKMILEWLKTAHEYEVNICDPEDLADFVAFTRPACVWAVLISKHHDESARE